MQDLLSTSIKYENNTLYIINQKALPKTTEWLACESPEQMGEYIKSLTVRGAPAIGISAVLSLADYALKGASIAEFKQAAEKLKAAWPTAVNLVICIDKLLEKLGNNDYPNAICNEAVNLFKEDEQLCKNIAEHGSVLINSHDKILTHCNTGGLATVGVGTALGIIINAHQQHKSIQVYVDETRPLLQGGRLTTWELEQHGVPYQLICDNMAASLMQKGMVQSIFVGADRIANNGDFANKIGTYSLAVLAKHHNIPFYVAAPYTTIDFDCTSGESIPVEQRDPAEVRGVKCGDEVLSFSPSDCAVYNPAFDVTPAELVTKFVLDTGVYMPEDIYSLRSTNG